MPAKLVDLMGRTLCGMRVIERAVGTHEASWLCECESCGRQSVHVGGKLRRGDSKCVCSGGHVRHLGTDSPLYSVWTNIRDRCTRPANKSFKSYGGRGISICRDWEHNFPEFEKWALAAGWSKGKQIDRINNDGNYEPSNCRFVTPSENCRNTSRNRRVTFNGKTRLLVEWSEELGTPLPVILGRLNRYGWSIERTLSTAYKPAKKRKSA